jgi:hypothetical protein
MFDLYARLFGVTFREVGGAATWPTMVRPAWHEPTRDHHDRHKRQGQRTRQISTVAHEPTRAHHDRHKRQDQRTREIA